MASSILARLQVLLSGDASGLNKSLKTSSKELTTFGKVAGGVTSSLTGLIAGVSFAALARQIIDVTSSFQKFEAVLTNTLGSNSAAQEALNSIRDFAAKTPFSVQELTSSFVKLANQGFKPTRDEMTKLGDLASSTGKSFDQLTEAIIDAQVGEFERLKEFGIRASKQGDQVKFTFKGVETQTKFTADAIRDYVLSLGQVEGVSGSMAAISETLGGKISNLGDSFDNLLLTLGNLSGGVLTGFIDILNESLQSLTETLNPSKIPTRLEAIKELYVEGADSAEKMAANIDKLSRLMKIEQGNYDNTAESLGGLKDQVNLSAEEFLKLSQEQATAKEFVDAYKIAIEELTAKMGALNSKQAEQVPLIKSIQAQIKHFEELKNAAFDEASIGRFNFKIQELKDQLDVLNATGFESGFLKNLNAGVKVDVPDVETPNISDNNPFRTTLDVDIQPYLDKLQETADAENAFGLNQEELAEQRRARHQEVLAQLEREQEARMRAADTALAYGSAVGDALGEAISGEKSFADTLKSVTKKVLDLLLKQALGAIVASAAKSGGPPPVAIALAAAGVAAISAMFSKIGGSSGSAGGGSAGASARVNTDKISEPIGSSSFRVEFAPLKLSGNDLVAAVANTQDQNNRLRG